MDYSGILMDAARDGNIPLAKEMIEKGATSFNLAMGEAVDYGHIEMVKLLLDKANNYNYGFVGGAFNGRIDIMQLMISRGANEYNRALKFAAQGGHIDSVEFLISKGANNYDSAIRRSSNDDIKRLLEIYKEGKVKL